MIQFQSKFRSIRIITRTSPSTAPPLFLPDPSLFTGLSLLRLSFTFRHLPYLFFQFIQFTIYFSRIEYLENILLLESIYLTRAKRICVYLVDETSENFKGTGSVRTCFINFELGHEDVQFSARERRIPRSPPLSPPVQPSSIALFIRVQNSLTLPERLEHLLLLSPGL